MKATFLLLCILSLCSQGMAALPVVERWFNQRDDLSEYELVRVVPNAHSHLECVLLAQSEHQAVMFNQSDATCRMFRCLLGSSGCRKCRNAANSSLLQLQVRPIDQLGRSCWRTFQRRVDNSTDFYLNWTSYLTPFGQGEHRNYWMGLEAIHQLTQAADRRVRWEMSMWNGSWWWWENPFFAVQGSAQGYRVSLGSQDVASSNIIPNEASGYHMMNNQRFSTFDNDQDSKAGANCAMAFRSGWWHNACMYFNPNGLYLNPPTAYQLTSLSLWATGLTFGSPSNTYPFNYDYSMQTVECLVADVATGI